MAELANGVAKINGHVVTGVENVTSNFEFITISTAVDIRTAGQSGGSANSQKALDKLIEVVSQRGQPVIMGNVTGSSAPFGVIFASEHAGAWQNAGSTALKNKIIADGVNYGFGVNVNGVDDTGLSVTFSNVLT